MIGKAFIVTINANPMITTTGKKVPILEVEHDEKQFGVL